MRPRRVLASQDASEIFDFAVRERALAVLSLQDGQNWITFKARFLERDPNRRFFVLDHYSQSAEPLPVLCPGQYLGVSFRHRSRKVLFTTIVEAKGHFVMEDRTAVPAIRYRWPTALLELQRRAYHRTPLPANMPVAVRIWSGGVGAISGSPTMPPPVATGDLVNLSCGGAMVRPATSALPEWAQDETLAVELALPDGRPPARLDAHFRGCRADETGQMGLAVQFVGLEVSVDGRVALQRLSNFLQRLNRMSLTSSVPRWSSSEQQRSTPRDD